MDTVEIITVAIGTITILLLGMLIVLLRTWYVVERRPARVRLSAQGSTQNSTPAAPEVEQETRQVA